MAAPRQRPRPRTYRHAAGDPTPSLLETLIDRARRSDTVLLGSGGVALLGGLGLAGVYLFRRLQQRRRLLNRLGLADDNEYANPIPFSWGGDDPRAVSEEIQSYLRAHQKLLHRPEQLLNLQVDERIEGLANIGNTCYMNSIIQALCSMSGFGEYLCELQSLRPQSEFVRHMVRFYQGRNGDPQAFHHVIARYTDQFGGYDQQDAHELFGFVVAILAEEMAHGRRLQEQLLARQAVDELDQFLLPEDSDSEDGETLPPDKQASSGSPPASPSGAAAASSDEPPSVGGDNGSPSASPRSTRTSPTRRHQSSVLARPLNPFAGLESNLLQCNTCNNLSQVLHESFTSLHVNVNNQGGNVLASLQQYSRAEFLQGVRCEFCGSRMTLDNLKQALGRLERRRQKLQPLGPDEEGKEDGDGRLQLLDNQERQLRLRLTQLCERICEIDPRLFRQYAAELGLPDADAHQLSEEQLRVFAEQLSLLQPTQGDARGSPDGSVSSVSSAGSAAASDDASSPPSRSGRDIQLPELVVDPFAGTRDLALTPALSPVISMPEQLVARDDAAQVSFETAQATLKDLDVADVIQKCFFQKQLCFARLPKLLCIHINRLMGGYKDSSWVSFPTMLDLTAFQKTVMSRYAHGAFPGQRAGPFGGRGAPRVPQEDDSDDESAEHKDAGGDGFGLGGGGRKNGCRYRLCAVVVHLGAAGGGHFITYRRRRPVPPKKARKQAAGKTPVQDWLRISDSHVQEVGEEAVLRSEAYLLFYERLR